MLRPLRRGRSAVNEVLNFSLQNVASIGGARRPLVVIRLGYDADSGISVASAIAASVLSRIKARLSERAAQLDRRRVHGVRPRGT
jgi:hypothetical protein